MGLQLTRGGEYAVRAMTYLARFPEGHVAALHDIGQAQDIPESFLAKIFQSLVHAGLVVSRRGARGGFALARPSDQITVRQDIEAVDGPIALNGCVLYPESCERSSDCRMRNVWLCTQQGMTGALDGATFADLGATAEQASAAAQPLLQ